VLNTSQQVSGDKCSDLFIVNVENGPSIFWRNSQLSAALKPFPFDQGTCERSYKLTYGLDNGLGGSAGATFVNSTGQWAHCTGPDCFLPDACNDMPTLVFSRATVPTGTLRLQTANDPNTQLVVDLTPTVVPPPIH
jgi:hypothetical protein